MARGGNQIIPRPPDFRPGGPNPWIGRLTPAHVHPERVERVLSELAAGLRPTVPNEVMHPPVLTATRSAAVLIPLFVTAHETRVLLTRRSGHMRNHRGEVAFPGGRVDDGEAPVDAALRETNEEIGLQREQVRVIGQIEPLWTLMSKAEVIPFVGVVDTPLPPLAHNPIEVERIFDVGLLELIEEDCYHEEIWDRPFGNSRLHFFDVEGDTIWGATGRLLHRLLTLLADPDALRPTPSGPSATFVSER